jgi:hypothetical protein
VLNVLKSLETRLVPSEENKGTCTLTGFSEELDRVLKDRDSGENVTAELPKATAASHNSIYLGEVKHQVDLGDGAHLVVPTARPEEVCAAGKTTAKTMPWCCFGQRRLFHFFRTRDEEACL